MRRWEAKAHNLFSKANLFFALEWGQPANPSLEVFRAEHYSNFDWKLLFKRCHKRISINSEGNWLLTRNPLTETSFTLQKHALDYKRLFSLGTGALCVCIVWVISVFHKNQNRRTKRNYCGQERKKSSSLIIKIKGGEYLWPQNVSSLSDFGY